MRKRRRGSQRGGKGRKETRPTFFRILDSLTQEKWPRGGEGGGKKERGVYFYSYFPSLPCREEGAPMRGEKR